MPIAPPIPDGSRPGSLGPGHRGGWGRYGYGMDSTRKTTGWDRGFRRALGWMAVGSLTFAAVVGLIVIIAGWRWRYVGETLGTTALFGLSASLALACVWARESIRPRGWQVAALLLGAALAWIGWLAAVPAFWARATYAAFGFADAWDMSKLFWRIAGPSYFCAGAVAYCGLFALLRVRGPALWMRRVGCAGALAIAAGFTYITIFDDPGELLARAMAAAAIVAGSLVVIVPLMVVIFPSMRIRRNEASRGEITVMHACPACASVHPIVVGRRVECASCGLGVELKLDAPVCACGYDLAGLTTTICPECGQAVEQRHRWALAIQEALPGAPMPESSSALPTSSSTRSA